MIIQSNDRPPERVARLTELLDVLHSAGYRLTSQRRVILDALVFSERHPSAEDLYREVLRVHPTMSRATVYKTLDVLRRTGQVLELDSREGGPGNRYDGFKPHSHPHLVCTSCGAIADAEDEAMTDRVRHLARSSGYQLEGYRVDLYGRCSQCRSAGQSSQMNSMMQRA